MFILNNSNELEKSQAFDSIQMNFRNFYIKILPMNTKSSRNIRLLRLIYYGFNFVFIFYLIYMN